MNKLLPSLSEMAKGLWPRRTTAEQSRTLLRLIATAAEERQPFAPLLECLARDERGGQRRRLFRLVRLLNEQVPLADALEQVPGILSDDQMLALRFDAQSGLRTASVRAIVDEAPRRSVPRRHELRGTLAYVCCMLPIASLIASFVQIKNTPVLLRIGSDFGVHESPAMLWTRNAQGRIFEGLWLTLLAACLVLGLIYSTPTGRWLRRRLIGSALNPWRDAYIADVLRKLSIATSGGRPLTAAISTLARHHFDPVIRHKLLYVRNEVELGADTWDSLHAVGLLTPADVRLLMTSARIGNQAWVLRQLADEKQNRSARRWRRRAVLVLPACVILFGGLVLIQALALFLPLCEFLKA